MKGIRTYFSKQERAGAKSDSEIGTVQKKKWSKKRKTVTAVALAMVVVLTVTVVFQVWRRRAARSQVATASVQETTVQTGSVSNTIVGTGNLSLEESLAITIPSGVTVTQVNVESGDQVAEGDVLALVDATSVQDTMETVEEELEELDEKIADCSSSTTTSTIKAGVSGRVKAVYVKKGSDVQDVMAQSGALMTLSLDGYMAVDITAPDGLSEDDSVKVETDEKTFSGTVESVSAGTAVILFSDKGTGVGDKVKVTDTSGNALGNGTAYIHMPRTITATSGSVSSVLVSKEQSVSSSTSLLTVKTSEEAKYAAYVAQREELAQNLQQLIQLSQTGSITAETAGTIATVQVTASGSTSTSQSTASAGSASQGAASAETISTDTASVDTQQVQTGAFTTLSTVTSQSGGTSQSISTDTAQQAPSNAPKPDAPAQSSEGTTQQAATTEASTEAAATTEAASTEAAAATQQAATTEAAATTAAAATTETANPTQEQTKEQTPADTAEQKQTSSAQQPSSSQSASAAQSSTVTVAASGSTDTTTSDTSSTSSVTAFTMASDSTMQLEVSVDELDINSVSVGQEAEVTLDAIEDTTFTGSVQKVSNSASSSSGGVAKYTVQLSIPKDDQMKAGMNASATIVIEKKENVLTLPVTALSERGNSVFVYTKKDSEGNLSGEQEVTTGLSDGTTVEITDGLSEGDTVYYQKLGGSSSNSSDSGNGMGDMQGGMPGGGDAPGDMPQGGFDGSSMGGAPGGGQGN